MSFSIALPPCRGIFWRIAGAGFGVLVGVAFGTIEGMAMQVMESKPAASAVMDGSETEFFVRFDGPVDHAASRLVVIRDGKVVQTLRPRLESQPNVLYSGVGRLAPGAYTLKWTTQSVQDHTGLQGEIPFTVR